MKKITILLTTILMSVLACEAAETAGSVLKHAVDKMKSGAIEAVFTVAAPGVSNAGTMTIEGDRFRILTDDLSTWYDGKTQWTLSTSTMEVNITNPTREELAEVNPLLVLGSLSTHYNAEMAGSATGSYQIVLVAKQQDWPIASARVQVDATTWFPQAIDINTSAGQQFKITIKSIKKINKVDKGTFSFNPAAYPGVEIIDLR